MVAVMTFGERIKQARRAAGLSQQELADRIGVSRMSICKYESGAVLPTHDHTIQLMMALVDTFTEIVDNYKNRAINAENFIRNMEQSAKWYRVERMKE